MPFADQTQQSLVGTTLRLSVHSCGGGGKGEDDFVFSWENGPKRRLILDAKEELEERGSSSFYILL